MFSFFVQGSHSLRITSYSLFCLGLVTWSVPVTGNENFYSKPPGRWTQEEALQVLNDSPWAHTVTTSTQDAPCSYENPVFPGLFAADKARILDSQLLFPASSSVKPDHAEYLVRLISLKPIQAAVERLVRDERWAPYGEHRVSMSEEGGPTNPAERHYNWGDLITVAVILKHPGPEGESFIDYAFKDGKIFPAVGVYLGACAGLRTTNGQVAYVLGNLGGDLNPGGFSAIQLAFPRFVDGKPLISHTKEKLEFRFVANQRVFETTFTVDPTDMLDGSEAYLYLPFTVTDPRTVAQK